MMKLRASAVPTALRCPGSVRPDDGELLVNQDSDAAALGTAAHAACRSLVEEGSVDWSSIPTVARVHDVDPDELRFLCSKAAGLWSEVVWSYPDAETERELSSYSAPLLLTGHADIVSLTPPVGRIADWKFGFKDHDYSPQLKAYAFILFGEYPSLEEVTSTVLWVRDGEAENYTMMRTEAGAWGETVADLVANWDGVYHTGPQCEWCQRSHSCPAARAMVRRTVEAFVPGDVAAHLSAMTPDRVISLLEQAKMVERYAKDAQRIVKALVGQLGEIRGSSQRLYLEDSPKRKLLPLQAFPVLETVGFGDAELAGCIRINISDAEAVVAKRAGRGKGAGAVRELRRQLEAAQAIETVPGTRLMTKRI